MRSKLVSTAGLGLLALSAMASTPAQQSSAGPYVAEYTATYEVNYNSRNLGTAEFSVEARDDGTFVFESRTVASGLLRLARPNPLLERSRFEIASGEICPLSFEYEDGSRKGADNFRAEFAWEAGIVVVEHGSGRTEHELTEGVLDRGSMQVALMRDLARNAPVGPYKLLDEDGIEQYTYERAADERIETPAGEFATRVYVQQREGSSRLTRLWVAPELEFLPVRIAQFRNGELNTEFRLEQAQGLSR